MSAGRATLPQVQALDAQPSDATMRRRERNAERKRLHRLREALGIMVAEAEVGPELQEALEEAGYLDATQAHDRKALGRALVDAARTTLSINRRDKMRHA